jgi:hypothetical protein
MTRHPLIVKRQIKVPFNREKIGKTNRAKLPTFARQLPTFGFRLPTFERFAERLAQSVGVGTACSRQGEGKALAHLAGSRFCDAGNFPNRQLPANKLLTARCGCANLAKSVTKKRPEKYIN